MSEDGDDDVELLSDLEETDFLKGKGEHESDGSDSEDSDSGEDSDRELQIAFKKGLLKPGLNFAVDAPRTAVNNAAALTQILVDLKQNLKFPERLDVIPSKAQLSTKKEKKNKKAVVPKNDNLSDNVPTLTTEIEDIDDDFKREMAFCHLAQLAVLEAIPRLHSFGIPTKRPEDYFAEMSKTDAHMQRIRQKLVQKKAEIEVRNRARQMRQLRKESKYIQEEVLKRRQAEKKLLNETAKKYSSDAKSKEDLEEMLGGKKKGQQQPQKKNQPQKTNKRRDWKNKKFGYGGQKKRSKWNTADSVDDLASHRKKGTMTFARVNRNKPGGNKRMKKQRPGKIARSQARGKNRKH